MKRILIVLLAFAGSLALPAANAGAWPERPVKIIVPFPAGGPADNAMRIVGNRLSQVWGQPVVVENKSGAPGMVAVATAAPDGLTLLLGAASNIVTAPLINRRLAYKPDDFTPVSMLVTSTSILTAHPSLHVRNVKELVDYARRHPGQINYSSSGVGSPGHLMVELFEQRTGTRMTHVPYKGGAPAMTELMAGYVQIGINATPTVLPYVRAGKLVPLAVASRKRDPALPDVPTMTEAGVPDLAFDVWYGIFAPAKTPASLVERISADIRRVLAEPEIDKQVHGQGNAPAGSTPAELARRVQDEGRVWSRLIRERKLSIDE